MVTTPVTRIGVASTSSEDLRLRIGEKSDGTTFYLTSMTQDAPERLDKTAPFPIPHIISSQLFIFNQPHIPEAMHGIVHPVSPPSKPPTERPPLST